MATLKGLKRQCKRITSKVRHNTDYKTDYYKIVHYPKFALYAVEYDGDIDRYFNSLDEIATYLAGIELAIDLYVD